MAAFTCRSKQNGALTRNRQFEVDIPGGAVTIREDDFSLVPPRLFEIIFQKRVHPNDIRFAIHLFYPSYHKFFVYKRIIEIGIINQAAVPTFVSAPGKSAPSRRKLKHSSRRWGGRVAFKYLQIHTVTIHKTDSPLI